MPVPPVSSALTRVLSACRGPIAVTHASFVGLLISAVLPAQTYTADYGRWLVIGLAHTKSSPEASYHPISSPTVATAAGYPNRGVPGAESRTYGEARASGYELSAYGYGTSPNSSPGRGMAFATCEFTDVVFSDGGTTPQTIGVQAQFEVRGERSGTSFTPNYDGYYVRADFGPGASWWSTNGIYLQPTPTPVTIVSSSGQSAPGSGGLLMVPTNTPLTFRIVLLSSGIGTNGTWSSCQTHLKWEGFIVPPGITANSAQADLVNNVRSVPPPDISPLTYSSFPVLASNPSFDVNFGRGEAGGLGVFMFGGFPIQNQVHIIDEFALGLPWTPIVTSVFIADGNGAATYTMPLYPALAGMPLGIQCAQLAGAQPKAYGTNALLVVVR